MLKMHVVVWHQSYTEFLYLITNHTTDAIKAVIQTVNMKPRKFKKMSETLKKTCQLKQDSQSKCSNCPSWAFTQACCIGIENKKSFVKIKPVLVVRDVDI